MLSRIIREVIWTAVFSVALGAAGTIVGLSGGSLEKSVPLGVFGLILAWITPRGQG